MRGANWAFALAPAFYLLTNQVITILRALPPPGVKPPRRPWAARTVNTITVTGAVAALALASYLAIGDRVWH